MKKATHISAVGKPTITISLKPHLADFCRYLFNETKEGAIILTRHHDFGKQISSVVQPCELPMRRPLRPNPITFVLPVTSNNHYALSNSFCTVSKWGEEKINDYIETEFKRTVRDLFEAGYSKNYHQKGIVESIVKGFNIKNNSLNFEAIKKIDYRRREKKRLNLFLELQATIL